MFWLVLVTVLLGIYLAYTEWNKSEVLEHAISQEKTKALLSQILMILTTIGTLVSLGSIPVVGPLVQTLYDILGVAVQELDGVWVAVSAIIEFGLLVWSVIKVRFFTKSGGVVEAMSYVGLAELHSAKKTNASVVIDTIKEYASA